MKKIEQEGEQKKTQEGKKRSSETEDHEKQSLATLKRLKRGDENKMERNLKPEKVDASKTSGWTWRQMKEEQNLRMMQLIRLAKEMDKERKARLENMVATIRLRLAWRWMKKEKEDWRMW